MKKAHFWFRTSNPDRKNEAMVKPWPVDIMCLVPGVSVPGEYPSGKQSNSGANVTTLGLQLPSKTAMGATGLGCSWDFLSPTIGLMAIRQATKTNAPRP